MADPTLKGIEIYADPKGPILGGIELVVEPKGPILGGIELVVEPNYPRFQGFEMVMSTPKANKVVLGGVKLKTIIEGIKKLTIDG